MPKKDAPNPSRKPCIKKQTIKDLEPKKAGDVKGGVLSTGTYCTARCR